VADSLTRTLQRGGVRSLLVCPFHSTIFWTGYANEGLDKESALQDLCAAQTWVFSRLKNLQILHFQYDYSQISGRRNVAQRKTDFALSCLHTLKWVYIKNTSISDQLPICTGRFTTLNRTVTGSCRQRNRQVVISRGNAWERRSHCGNAAGKHGDGAPIVKVSANALWTAPWTIFRPIGTTLHHFAYIQSRNISRGW